MGYAWAVGMQAGYWLCHITGIDWIWEMPCDGHDYLVCRLDTGWHVRGIEV